MFTVLIAAQNCAAPLPQDFSESTAHPDTPEFDRLCCEAHSLREETIKTFINHTKSFARP